MSTIPFPQLDLPGLTFRGFRGKQDFPEMLATIAAAAAADGLEDSRTPEDIEHNYRHMVNCDLDRDLIFAEVQGRLVAYGRVDWRQTEAGERLYNHFAHSVPEWRRRGLGRAMLGWMQARLRQVAADHPQDGPRFFNTFAMTTQAGQEALLLADGYSVVRYGYSMKRPLGAGAPIPPVPLPAGLEVRPARPEHFRAIWEADQEAFRDHWGFTPAGEEGYQSWLDNPDFAPQLWQVAWDGGQVAGMVQNFVNTAENVRYNRRRGYTEGIFTRRAWRRRGLARALLTRSLQMFQEMGFTEAALGVDALNPNGALNLYQSVGFRVEREGRTYRRPL